MGKAKIEVGKRYYRQTDEKRSIWTVSEIKNKKVYASNCHLEDWQFLGVAERHWQRLPEVGEVWEDCNGSTVTVIGFDSDGDPRFKGAGDKNWTVFFMDMFVDNFSLKKEASEKHAIVTEGVTAAWDRDEALRLEEIAEQALRTARHAVGAYNDYLKRQPVQLKPKTFE